jgi:isoquinoline 1-oxidoreductase beta subunit
MFRRSLAALNPRALRVLDVLAEKSDWHHAARQGSGRGMALASAFGGLVASAVDLTAHGKEIKLQRIVTVVDCGRTLDPAIAESNILGGIVWGISGMRTGVTFSDGAVRETNFDTVNPAHLWETPPCEVHFVESGEKLGGTGELGPVPIHAAVCNALFAATGRRIRSLPLSDSGFTFA